MSCQNVGTTMGTNLLVPKGKMCHIADIWISGSTQVDLSEHSMVR